MALDERQNLAAKLLGAGTRSCDVADRVGVTRVTVSRWRQNPEFVEAIRNSQKEVFNVLVGKVLYGSVLSADLMNAVVQTEEVEVRVRVDAAKKLVDMGFKAYEFNELRRKLEEIDELIARNQDKRPQQFEYPEAPEHVKDLWKIQSQQLEIERMLLKSELDEKEKERIRQLLQRVGDTTTYQRQFGVPLPKQEPTFESDVEGRR